MGAFATGAVIGGATTFGIGIATGQGFGRSLAEGVLAAGIVYTVGTGLKGLKGDSAASIAD